MASVWAGEDTLLTRRVAVKTLHPELAVDDALRERFSREAVSAATLNHPNVVATYDTGRADGISYIVMELVEGQSLRWLLDDRGWLPVADAVRIAAQVAAALEHAHRRGIVHRDIKPANVLVPDSGGAVKVTDFGIAKATDSSDLTRVGTVMGTARYLAPEQVNGDPTDARTDLYALGLLLFEMLAGELPFTGETDLAAAVARLSRDPAPVRSLRPDVPPELDTLVTRLLARNPAGRFASAAQVQRELDHVAESRALARTAPPRTAPARTGVPGPGIPEDTSSGVRGPAVVAPPAARSGAQTRPPVAQPRLAPPRRRAWPVVALAIAVLGGGGAVGYLVARPTSPDDGGAPRVIGAVDFDPPPGDGVEHRDETTLAVDGHPSTAWTTERYRSLDLDPKGGVGLRVNLARGADVEEVTVETREPGWAARIYTSRAPGTTLSSWGPPLASGSDLGTRVIFRLDRSARARAVLLWITRLPGSGQLAVTEVHVG